MRTQVVSAAKHSLTQTALPLVRVTNPRRSLGIILMVLSLGLLATGVVLAAAGDISTVAGTGTAGFSGDGGAATSANLNFH